MAHTNETTNLQLPQFVASDKPTWLGDVNGAMAKIDTAYGTIQAEATGAGATAQQALAAANAATQTANTALATAGTSATSSSEALSLANNALTVANNTAALAGQIVNEIGDLDDLQTTEKSTLVGAINEVAAGGGATTAENVSYNNATSGLGATNVQSAIDELASGGGGVDRTVLWTNSDPDNVNGFGSQTVTLTDNINNYSEIEFIFKSGINVGNVTSADEFHKTSTYVDPNSTGHMFQITFTGVVQGTGLISSSSRSGTVQGTQASFNATHITRVTTGGQVTDLDDVTTYIPVMIIGHKYLQ